MEPRKIVIIGAGIGGLATANLLAHAGHSVTVIEKESSAGGRANRMEKDGFVFDTGPSWYLMPGVFEQYYRLLGESVEDWLSLQRLTPAYKVFFETAPPMVITGDIAKDAKTFEGIEAGAGAQLRRYIKESDVIYQLSLRHFLYSNFERASDFFQRDIVAQIAKLPRLLLQSIDRSVSKYFSDFRLKQIMQYPMVFLGTSPFTAPSMYRLMSALDFKEGVFYPQGGMYTIIESLVAIGERKGVTYRYHTTVESITTSAGMATGVRLASDDIIPADIVISNADIHFTETQLLAPEDQSFSPAYWGRREAGPSALLMYLGIDGLIDEFEHHTLLFVRDWKKNFDAIYVDKVAPDRASIYISKTSQTDPTAAPEGDENIFILVPLPSGVDIDRAQAEQLGDQYLAQIKEMTGVDLAARSKVRELFAPNEFEERYFSWQSSMLGQSHLLRQSAFFRTPNMSKKVRNLYYVGASTTPGIGLPMCLIGAELVYKRIIGDTKGGPVEVIKRVDTA